MTGLKFKVNAINFSNSKLKVACELNCDAGVIHLVGDNGSGKTSVLNAISGILDFEGKASIDGMCLKKRSTQAKKLISYCPDKYHFSDLLTPNEFLNFVSQSYGLNNKLAYTELMCKFGVEDHLLNKQISQLSYGTVKKMLLTACFIPNPKIILMDEPLNGLDEKGKSVLCQHIQTYKNDIIYIIVCHDNEWMNQYDPIKIRI